MLMQIYDSGSYEDPQEVTKADGQTLGEIKFCYQRLHFHFGCEPRMEAPSETSPVCLAGTGS